MNLGIQKCILSKNTDVQGVHRSVWLACLSGFCSYVAFSERCTSTESFSTYFNEVQ